MQNSQPSTNVSVLTIPQTPFRLTPADEDLCSRLDASARLIAANVQISGWRHRALHLIYGNPSPQNVLQELSRRVQAQIVLVSVPSWDTNHTPRWIAHAINNVTHSIYIILVLNDIQALHGADTRDDGWRQVVCAQCQELVTRPDGVLGSGFSDEGILVLQRSPIIATCSHESAASLPVCFSQFLPAHTTAPTLDEVERQIRELGAALRLNQSTFDPNQLAAAATDSDNTERWIDEWMLEQLIRNPAVADEYSIAPTEILDNSGSENDADHTPDIVSRRISSRHAALTDLVKRMDVSVTTILNRCRDLNRLHSVKVLDEPPLGYVIRFETNDTTAAITITVDALKCSDEIRLLVHDKNGEIVTDEPISTAMLAFARLKRVLKL